MELQNLVLNYEPFEHFEKERLTKHFSLVIVAAPHPVCCWPKHFIQPALNFTQFGEV